jgi:UDP-N-acetylmuramyl pentapeptide phosphotransferase/UDP-N-acetylglucosamine-1-phosphate transferase
MIEVIKNFIFFSNVSLFFLVSTILTLGVVLYYPKLFFLLRLPKYSGVQRIHENLTPRLGGLIIFIGILGFNIFSESFLLNYEGSSILSSILLFGGIIALLTVSEDIFHNTSPIYRIACTSIPTFLFFYFGNYNLPLIDMPILKGILSEPIFALFFYTFAITSVSNGFNLIDGANGLAGMTLICSFFCLLFLSVSVSDLSIAIFACVYLTFILAFLVFNYPFGKIFLGDSGAYFLGFSLSALLIIFFGRHDNVSPWNAILILFFPIMETVFSVFRKYFFEKTSPFKPDPHHLHSKVYFLMKDSGLTSGKENNNLVLPFLSVVWATPLLLMPWVFEHNLLIIGFIIFMSIQYVIFYSFIPRHKIN